MVDNIVDRKDNMAEKTMEVGEIRIYHFSVGIFFNWDVICRSYGGWHHFFTILTGVTTLRSCVLMVEDTVDGMDN